MKTFEEIWAEIAEENLKEILSYNIKQLDKYKSDPFQKETKENIAKAYEYYNQLREKILNGGSLVYSEKPAWIIFDYNHFKFDNDKGFDPGHDNFNTDEFLETYGFEDHWFYLAWIKGYKTPMKIKMHIDPCSSIEVVSLGYRNANDDSCIYFWDWPEKFLAFMPLPELPENLKEEQHD